MTAIRDYLPSGPLVLDTSAVINILGCGHVDAVFEGLRDECLLEEHALGELTRHPVRGISHTDEIERLAQAGHLRIVRMDDAEYEIYLSLVQGPLGSRLDAGESASIAIAVSRRLGVILDESKARRIFAARPDRTEHASTLKLLFSVAYNSSWTVDHLTTVIASAKAHARLGVPKDDLHLLSLLSL